MRVEKPVAGRIESSNPSGPRLTLSQAAKALKRRVQLVRYGIFSLPGREIRIPSVRIANRAVQIILPEGERRAQTFELASMVYFDCYRLARVQRPVSTVLDIGANLGFFALAARRRFPEAKIHSYEPNEDLKPYLEAHCSAAGADHFLAAVGAASGRVDLDKHGSTLHSVSHECEDGATPQIAFAESVERLGTVDLLKLDCEGAEWDIFSDPRPWANVRNLAMEYHLWARPSLSIDDLRHHLSTLGFSEILIEPDRTGDWGMAWATRNQAV